jgi:hypothetical protein
MKILKNNTSISRKDGDWVDIIKTGIYSEIIKELIEGQIENSNAIMKDIQPIIDEYTGDGDINICLIRLGNCNRWSNYSLIFDENSELYEEVDIPYNNDMLSNIFFDTDEHKWCYQSRSYH